MSLPTKWQVTPSSEQFSQADEQHITADIMKSNFTTVECIRAILGSEE
jgi:hypothetical protein